MKRFFAAALAAVLVATAAPAVGNAANVDFKAVTASVTVEQDTQEKFDKGEVATVKDGAVEESVKKEADNTVTITEVKSDAKTVKIAGTVNGLPVRKISSKAFKNCSKAKTIDLRDCELEELAKKQFSGAKKAKTVKINAKKLKTSKISSKALKGFKGKKIVIKGVSKKKFNKIVNKLKKSAGKQVTFKREK
ncbi:leucine-rich repeat protein [Butyrivibrio sp. FC2001]|uniref:leucine-rich repeat protein n=1 Tax=Butyrivibrio sp. FC2001 TaxID=1280671 RepID=UPI00042070B7|nr:leucine-rich repeat protein [Butyrivibrio sp. FC2001]